MIFAPDGGQCSGEQLRLTSPVICYSGRWPINFRPIDTATWMRNPVRRLIDWTQRLLLASTGW